MLRIVRSCVSLMLLGLLGACQTAVVSIGAVDAPAPVLIGPVLLLGGQATVPPAAGTRFAGGAVAVPSQQPARLQINEPLDQNVTEWLVSRDDLPLQLARALDGQPGKALYVERIRVIDAVHWTALFYLDKQLLAEGYVFRPPRVDPYQGGR